MALLFVFKRISILFSIMVVPITFPPTLSPVFIVCRFFGDGLSDRCGVIPYCSFDLHFSDNE